MEFSGCNGTACLTMVFISGCTGILAPASGATPHTSTLTLMPAELLVSHVLTPFSQLLLLSGFKLLLNTLFNYADANANPNLTMLMAANPLLLMDFRWPEAGPSCIWLELFVLYMRATLAYSPVIHP